MINSPAIEKRNPSQESDGIVFTPEQIREIMQRASVTYRMLRSIRPHTRRYTITTLPPHIRYLTHR
jgi:hypothetical protein